MAPEGHLIFHLLGDYRAWGVGSNLCCQSAELRNFRSSPGALGRSLGEWNPPQEALGFHFSALLNPRSVGWMDGCAAPTWAVLAWCSHGEEHHLGWRTWLLFKVLFMCPL